ncbi:hypothetical protein D3C73_588420 [compost metagenome]
MGTMKRKLKWKRVPLLIAGMGLCFTAGVYAQDAMQKVEAYIRNDFNVVVNGEKKVLENKPLVYNNNSYLPVKELASYLGGIVNWDGASQTIYINSRINPEQPDTGKGEVYESITLMSPYVAQLHYLGGEFTVLQNMTDKTYYRHKDILAMGIKTSGLRLAKEKYTQELYISEDELKKAWKETPQVGFSTELVPIIGETNPKKREALKNYVELQRNAPHFNPANPKVPEYRFIQPVYVEALPTENTYAFLFIDNQRHFYMTSLTLGKNLHTFEESYGVSSSTTEDIQARKVE